MHKPEFTLRNAEPDEFEEVGKLMVRFIINRKDFQISTTIVTPRCLPV